MNRPWAIEAQYFRLTAADGANRPSDAADYRDEHQAIASAMF